MKIGRNDPCLCGSGKKLKKCCGKDGTATIIKPSMFIDYSKVQKKNINWPDYTYPAKPETTSEKEFEMTEDGLNFIGTSNIVYVPEIINGIKVTTIAPQGFANSNVREVYLPPTVEVIENQAFDQCTSLKKIELPPSLKKIGRWAFQGCSSLEIVYIFDGLEVLDGYAFDECSRLRAVRLPSEIDYIGAYAFSETALEQVVLPAGIEYLGNSIFYGCTQLERVFFQEGLQEIGSFAFANCINLRAVHFPASLEVIRQAAFQGCAGLEEVLVQNNIKTVDEHAFAGCGNIKKFIAPFTFDVKVELFDPMQDFLPSNSVSKNHGYLGSIILSENVSRGNFIDWMYMEDTARFTDELLVKANEQYGLGMKIGTKEDTFSDFEEFMLGEEIIEESTEPSLKDKYVQLLSEGVMAKRNGDIQAAKKKYVEAIHMQQTESTAYYNLGKILYIEGSYEESVRAYKTALELGYDYRETLRHLGHSLLDAEQKNEKYSAVINQYLEGIHPALAKERLLAGRKSRASKTEMDEYDKQCIEAAEAYLADKKE